MTSLNWLVGGLLATVASLSIAQPTPPLTMRLRLSAPDGQPLARTPVRVVGAAARDWQKATSGERLVTDASGSLSTSIADAVERRQRKRPTNFFTQSASPAQEVVHVAIGVELPYVGRPWLVVFDGDRFPDGTTAWDSVPRVYGLGADGAFSVAATFRDGAWTLPGMPGRLTAFGYDAQTLSIAPEGAGWRVDIALTQRAEPVRR